MDARSAAHVLAQIAAYLELAGENRFKARAYQTAARALQSLGVADLSRMLRSGELGRVRGLGPATLAVIRDLHESGESSYLEQLRARLPDGLLELMRLPGLSTDRIHRLHAELGITSLDALEVAAREGSLARLKGVGPKTAQKILKDIAFVREAGALRLYPHALAEAERLLALVRSHPDVVAAELAGSLRRKREVVADVDIVASCAGDPGAVASSFARTPGLRDASTAGGAARLRFVDGTGLDLYCVAPTSHGAALWRATGSREHVEEVQAHLGSRGFRLEADTLFDRHGVPVVTADEPALYAALGLSWIVPELREGRGEVAAAHAHALPTLVEPSDIQGALHCHTDYSDGGSSIAEMAAAARERGWRYIGISDHSQAAFYASGVSRDRMHAQHDEIDALNALNARDSGFRILKGVEADILADGRLDYDEELLSRFDYVIGSIHSRFRMDGPAMTKRVLRAMDDPHMTILAHPTGRLLLAREPYELDVDAVLQKAAEVGVAIEVNADPRRMDLDWRHLPRAKALGVVIEIAPDAHSAAALLWTDLGVSLARKGWLEAGDVLNARSAADVRAFARRRRA